MSKNYLTYQQGHFSVWGTMKIFSHHFHWKYGPAFQWKSGGSSEPTEPPLGTGLPMSFYRKTLQLGLAKPFLFYQEEIHQKDTTFTG